MDTQAQTATDEGDAQVVAPPFERFLSGPGSAEGAFDGPFSLGGGPNAPSLLLADDDAGDIVLFREVVEMTGCFSQMVVAHDGVHALELLREPTAAANCGIDSFQPSILVVDISMPRMNGIDFVGAYHELCTKSGVTALPAVFLTSSDSPQDRRRATEIPNVVDYYVKPHNLSGMEKLSERLKKLL